MSIDAVGIVAIGRNEGERLVACMESLGPLAAAAVYVDSGSSDGSVDAARARGLTVVELDLGTPFTAARARNAGFETLRAARPHIRFVQFVDGDCRIVPGWIEAAAAFLARHEDVAAVAGRRREVLPDASPYNALCDEEWNTPVGDALAVGGDCMMRAEAFRSVGGYAPDLIAGEEPELCARLRAKGWRIRRLDAEMTLHDAAMTRFAQWWRRTKRGGHAYAEVAARHAGSPVAIWRREERRALVWGAGLPVVALAGSVLAHPAFAIVLAAYPLQVARLWRRGSGSARARLRRAVFFTLAKFPEAQGALRYRAGRLVRRRVGLIEYK
ncbi:glycosyltransferase family 2 protein [Antarcticirhabdus aurantiaca]|uniref:Glycosyltransferase n=1 Tax=Antarcticirhabdus aurantiaca TaxID=2606717 RepID=A0ACD4NX17_9HYPH|nr:glycosyltransferase [Antarcticirhabdus aurantiaca]WAJ31107.1 glycosyltransferase [Jeongeuplla avenae]